MDDETLTFLLGGGHMDMPERMQRGLWPHPPLRMRQLARHIARVVKRQGFFPRPWRDHLEGEAVDEHGVVERRGPLHYVYRSQRAYPLNPYAIAEVAELRFLSPMAAARFYLKWDLHLPGNLDGWRVE